MTILERLRTSLTQHMDTRVSNPDTSAKHPKIDDSLKFPQRLIFLVSGEGIEPSTI